jgi:hypothetical protein
LAAGIDDVVVMVGDTIVVVVVDLYKRQQSQSKEHFENNGVDFIIIMMPRG